MVVFSNLGKKGNFGNQLFQIASTIGIATKNNHKFAFPKWEYAPCFVLTFPLYDEQVVYQLLKENNYHYNEIKLKEGNFDLNGWFQSEKYFNKELIKSYLKFKPELINKVKEKYLQVFSKKNILISVRRGDFVNHPYYFQLDYKYYFLAITTQFPDWKARNLIFTSDDIAYCKNHFQFLENAIFVDNLSVVEQLVLGTLCDDFIISNSTFSWWQAWLGEQNTSKVIRPFKNFRGIFETENNDKDYFPDRWILFKPKSLEISLTYSRLIVKGEFLKFLISTKHYYRFFIKKLKLFLKRIINFILNG